MAPRFNEPEILQIIKSIEKDEHYVEQFGTDLDEATKQLLGIRSWIRWHPILINVNKLLYYLLTTANGNQTLGEEYCHLIQIGNNQSIPSGIRRFILALLNGLKQSTLGEKFITLIRNRCGVQYQLSNVYSIGDLQRDLVHLFSLLNLTIFFLNGTFPDLLKRILSIRYLSLVRREGPIGVDPGM
ncbi:peroxisome biogenesis factor 10 [Blomia tropicalis]|nr:peroxisome biogenesis factor 10 [Blomia tropicalis]